MTEEHKKRIGKTNSELMKAYWKEEKVSDKVKESFKNVAQIRKEKYGYINSPHARELMSGIWKDKWAQGEVTEAQKNTLFKKGHKSGMTGRKHSEDTLKKMSKSRLKLYDEGILKKDFGIKFFKKQIRKRDNQICMSCGIHREKLTEALHVHHINYDEGLSIPENCISLCTSCHAKTNRFNRPYWISLFQDILSKQYGYQYKDNQPIINIEIKEI